MAAVEMIEITDVAVVNVARKLQIKKAEPNELKERVKAFKQMLQRCLKDIVRICIHAIRNEVRPTPNKNGTNYLLRDTTTQSLLYACNLFTGSVIDVIANAKLLKNL